MSKELIERLRVVWNTQLSNEAADRIEELERNIVELTHAHTFAREQRDALLADNAQLRSRIDELESTEKDNDAK